VDVCHPTQLAVPAPRAVLGSIPSDSHTWNLLFLRLLMEEQGWDVTNLGACLPIETLVAESVQDRPDLIVISTVNGHGLHEGADVARAVRAVPELDGVPLVIGGKLDTDGAADPAAFGALRAAGFDAVLVGDAAVPEFMGLLRRPHRTPARPARRKAYADAAL
jgi:methylaspartate mutase sigma subunit